MTVAFTLPEPRENGVLTRTEHFVLNTGWFTAAIEEIYELAQDLAEMAEEAAPIEYEDDEEEDEDDE